MPALAQHDHQQLAQNLHETNRRIRHLLEGLSSDHVPIAVAKPEQMAGLLSELLRAGEWLRSGVPQESERDAELAAELRSYRQNVERLRALLPWIQKVLLEEKARLERERSQLESAAEWARSSRTTL